MAVFDHFGELSTAQDITGGTPLQSENVVDLALLGIQGYGPDADVYIDLECETVTASGDSSDTFVFDFNVALTTDLDTGTRGTDFYTVISVPILGVADPRVTVAGAKILSCRIPDQVWQMAKEGFRYFGLQSTISATATLSVNCTISTSRPRTPDNQQVTESDVGVPT